MVFGIKNIDPHYKEWEIAIDYIQKNKTDNPREVFFVLNREKIFDIK
jgi:hypothetical protein